MTLHVTGLVYGYGPRRVLNGIDVRVPPGKTVGLVGPNGAGKSTLLKCLNRLLAPPRNTVTVDGKDINDLSLRQIARIFGYVPQTSHHTFPATVLETVLLGRCPFIGWRVTPGQRRRVYETLAQMDLEHLATRMFSELSGGEQQRTLIARALVQEPRFLILDEPTSNLDLRHQLSVLDHVAVVVAQKQVSVIMAIHDINLAAKYADHLMFLRQGEVYASGPPETVLVAENIRRVFGVDARINRDTGRPHLVPLKVSTGSGGDGAGGA